MKDETRIRGAAGRKVLADPRTHRYYLCLNDGENEKFISMFEQSGMKNKAEFIFARIFGWEFKVVKIDKEAQEYYAQLTAFYQQFRRIGNNYNQCVKTIHTIYGEKKSLAFLYKLAEETRKLEEVRALLDRAVEQQAGMVSPKRYIGNIAQKRKIELLEEQNEKLLKEMAALQEENNRLKKALGKRALNTIKNL